VSAGGPAGDSLVRPGTDGAEDAGGESGIDGGSGAAGGLDAGGTEQPSAIEEGTDQNGRAGPASASTAGPDGVESDPAITGAAEESRPTDVEPAGVQLEDGEVGDTRPAGGDPSVHAATATDPVTPEADVSAPASRFERGTFQIPPPPEPEAVAGTYGARVHPSARNRPLPRVMAVANQKGGVGKTTTAVNLGAALAELDYRVLVVDLDPQGNATTGLGINARNLDASIYDVILHDVPVEDVIEPTTLKNLFVVPATIDLAGAEIELVPVFSRELRLKKGLEPVIGDFDFVLIDCPPSLGLLTVNGLAAATEVAVPIQCEYYALEGLGQLLRNVGLVQTNLNGDLEVSTIILTMYDARTKLAEQVAEEVRQYFGDRVCRNVVPRTVRLSEAPSFGQPIIVFDSSSRGSIAYRELAKEVSGGAPKRTR
jgi:chromosome partitioning protein